MTAYDPQLAVEAGFLETASTSTYLVIGDTARGKLGTGTLGPSGGVWTDVAQWAQSVNITRGSTRVDGPVVQYEPGRMTVRLRNSDRRFDPTNLSGPYVTAGATQVVPMTPLRIRVTLGTSTGVRVAQTSAGAPVHTGYVITTTAEAAGLRVGDRVLWANSSGTAYDTVPRLVTNMNSGFGFTNVFVSPNLTGIAATGDTLTSTLLTYPLYQGYADGWPVAYPTPKYSDVTVGATDAFKIFTAAGRPAVTPVGAGELTGFRIARILSGIGWGTTDRVLDAGQTPLQNTALSGDALSEMQSTTLTELGELYMDGAGRVVFRDRHAVLLDARSNTSAATFGDGGGSELSYTDVVIGYDDTQLVNGALITRDGGAEQSAADATSQARYQQHVTSQSGLMMQSDGDALAYAQYLVYISKDPELRFDELTIKPQRDPGRLWPQVLGRELGDRITVVRRPPGGGTAITRDCFIRGIAHSWTPGGVWTTKWQLASATRYSFMVLGDSQLGQLNHNAIGY